MLEDSSFIAMQNKLTLDYVLMQDINCPNAKLQNTSVNEERLSPFYDVPTGKMVSSEQIKTVKIRGYSPYPSYTQSVRQQNILIAKYILENLLNLSENFQVLKQNAPNKSVKETIKNIKSEVFVASQIIKNIIKQFANNKNIKGLENAFNNDNSAFCTSLNKSIISNDKALKGIIKLIKTTNISNINAQLNVLSIVLANILSTLQQFKIYC